MYPIRFIRAQPKDVWLLQHDGIRRIDWYVEEFEISLEVQRRHDVSPLRIISQIG
jgi:hypothetical protein